jgi:membrane protease subunit HflK
LFFLPLLLAICFILLWTGFYTVGAEEVGVVTRFGKFREIAPPGLKFCIPFGVDRVDRVPVLRQMKAEFGFRTLRAGVRTEYDPKGYPKESLMVTAPERRDVRVVGPIPHHRSKAYLFQRP